MQLVSALAVITGLVVVGIPPMTEAHLPPEAVEAGSVRFSNNTAGTASVTANGGDLFTDVAAGETTRWADLTDSTVTFVMKAAVAPGDSAWVSQKIAEGGRYSLVGGTSADGKPTLTIEAGEASPPGTGS